jgi:hypothetical protein
MPLINSATKQAIRENTQREIAAGKKPGQAYAIANSVARRARKRRGHSA